jgi:mono/diheme cytochrome c family protein
MLRNGRTSVRGRWIVLSCLGILMSAWAGSGHGSPISRTRTAYDVLPLETALAASAQPGAAAYGQFCAACHQAAGQGMSGAFPPLAKDPVVNGDPHYLSRVVLYGLQGPVMVNGQAYNSAMAGFAGSMNDAQVSEVLTYIRSSWGNNASAVSADIVKAERAIPGTPQDNAAKHPK